MIEVVECPTCKGHGRAIRGYTNTGQPVLSGDCARCGRSGFVPLLDGQPSYPFGRDKQHPLLLALEDETRPVADHVQEKLL